MNEKELLRKRMKQRLDSQTFSERRKRSRVIQKRLLSQRKFLASKCVMLYVSKGTGEVETGPLIKKALDMHKRVVLPVIAAREKGIKPVVFKSQRQRLIKGAYGIYEPEEDRSGRSVRLEDIDLVIVPGLAFDRKNNRLGRGQGYYDRFLRRLPKDTPKIGLGFRFQLLKIIPTTRSEEHTSELQSH